MALAHVEFDATDESGNLLSNIEARVELEGGGLASIYSDRTGSTPYSNPQTFADGKVNFYVVGGAYKITLIVGAFSRVLRYKANGLLSEKDALAASAVSFTPTVTLLSTTVQAAIEEAATRPIATVQGTAVALTNNIATAQNIFAAANDTLTVQASTTYRFRAKLSFNTGATTHTTAFGFGGTATFTSIEYLSKAISAAANTLATPQMRRVTTAAAAVLTATSVAVTTDIWIEGIMRINGAGTIIPQVTFSAGPTGTCETAINSFFELEPIGSNTVAAVGAWA